MALGLLEGRSLSLCILDIMEGKVAECDVTRIVTSTRCGDRKTFEGLLDEYCQTYWDEYPDKAKKLALRFYDTGKIDQPRLRGEAHNNVSNGCWKSFDPATAQPDGPLQDWGKLGMHDPSLISCKVISDKAQADAAVVADGAINGVDVRPSRRITLKMPGR